MGANKGKTAMTEFLRDLWNDDRGISSVEYALLLSFVAAGVMVAADSLSLAVSNQMEQTATCISTGVALTPSAGC